MGGCPTHSFDAETLVSTIQGKIPISELEEGDWVLAYHELTGELGYYPVTKTWVHIDPIIVTLVIDGELIETTPNHPFYTDEGWLGAGELWVGAKVVRANGQVGQVEAITVETTPQLMYDLTINVAHTYFVGQQQWLVHNCSRRLNGNLGGTVGDQMQAHHLIPQEHISHPLVQNAQQAGWNHDAYYNGVLLPSSDELALQVELPVHRGSHPQYSTSVYSDLERMNLSNPNMSPQQAFDTLYRYNVNLRQNILNLPSGVRLQ